MPMWSHVNLHEGLRPEVGVAMTKDVGQLSLRFGVREAVKRDSGKKGLKQSESSTESVKAMAKQRPGSELRDKSAFLVAVWDFC